MAGHPIRLEVRDDLRRSRLTVFFRLLLAVPHFIWVSIWSFAAMFAAIIAWLIALLVGRVPAGLHEFIARYLRYRTHVFAYLTLSANPFPGFVGEPGSYPIDLQIAPPAAQARWKTLLRIFLVIPALGITGALAGGGGTGYGDTTGGSGVTATAAFLGWFASLITGRMPSGLRNSGSYTLRYMAQVQGYLFMLTDVYPDSTPSRDLPGRQPEHAVRLDVADDLRRSRLTVFFRLLLALPHLVWLALWSIVALVASTLNWLLTLVLGTSPEFLHRFLVAYIRYQVHVIAFVCLIANPFPGFTGAAGSYPADVSIGARQAQSRWITLARLVLIVPAWLMDAALTFALLTVAFLGWFVGVVIGRMPPGMRDLGAYALRYRAQTSAYGAVVTDQYPYSGPEASGAGPVDDESDVAAAA